MKDAYKLKKLVYPLNKINYYYLLLHNIKGGDPN